MSKTTLTKEIQKELEKLNDRIDRKIIKGHSYDKEARRHRELMATLRQLGVHERSSTGLLRRSRVGKSPVRRNLRRGAAARLFGFGFAV
jgi:hypothetical protein